MGILIDKVLALQALKPVQLKSLLYLGAVAACGETRLVRGPG